MESKPVTLRDIAREAGCSHSTVSLALRNHPRIPEKTRLAIQSLAAKMGYTTNPYVQSLLSQVRRGKVRPQQAGLALVSNYEKPEQWRQMPNNRLAVLGAFQRAAELGYSLEEFSLRSEGMNFDRLRRILLARGIRGVLIAPTPEDRLDLSMNIDPFAVVSMGQSLLNREISMVSHYHGHSMRTLIEELEARGYQKIGCSIDSGINQRIEEAWSAQYFQYQSKLPRTDQIPINLRPPDCSSEDFRSYLKKNRLDAIITDQDNYYEELPENLLQRPDLFGFGCLAIHPDKTTIGGIRQNNQMAGFRSVELLVQLINNGVFGVPDSPQTVFTPGQWEEGKTLRPRVVDP
ncbi:LacI family DNA-binding transcriptional regulator [Puniceicoccus vermicola]|uniref:LacI family DNA-binding transcriptional regulator n=1 Tax=Puniceicoccus vermicola TaxID=388746 RepID=A0A7X1B2S4_9BACT|nr:LacI family DNA-binding transcriptional regulator [Puniceicoccus vermicola]